MIRKIFKKFLPNIIYNILSGFYVILRNPKKELPNYILKRKFFVKDEKRNNLFSLRMMGGATLGRGTHFYIAEPETIDWIKNFNNDSVFFDIGANIGSTVYSLLNKQNVVSLNLKVIILQL